jgi:hypothetical protein
MALTSEPLNFTVWKWETPQCTFLISSRFEYFFPQGWEPCNNKLCVNWIVEKEGSTHKSGCIENWQIASSCVNYVFNVEGELILLLHIWKLLDSFLALRSVILTEILCGLPQSLQANAEIVPLPSIIFSSRFCHHLISYCHCIAWVTVCIFK